GTVLIGTIASLRLISFEESPFRNNNNIAGPKIDVVIKIPAVEKIFIIEYEYRLDSVDFPTDLDALRGSEWAETSCKGDCLHDVQFGPHYQRSRSENLSGDINPRFKILLQGFGRDETDGHVRFLGKFAFEARFDHVRECLRRQTGSPDLSHQWKLD